MAGKKDSAWEPRRSETPAFGLDMDDHLFPWGDITGLSEFSNTSVTTDPLEFLFSPLVSDPGGLSASDLSFPPSELSLRTETVAEGTPQCFSLVAIPNLDEQYVLIREKLDLITQKYLCTLINDLSKIKL